MLGLQAEFNYYIVCNTDQVLDDETDAPVIIKDGYRVYPMHAPLPVIYNGECLALAAVRHLEWKNHQTIIHCDLVLGFDRNDPVAAYYKESFAAYKQEQEEQNHGGRIDLRKLANGRERNVL